MYDGSAEARAIFVQAQEAIDFDLEGGGSDVVVADGILYHALDYLKGKDSVNPGMWTREFWDEEYTEELTEEDLSAIKAMTMKELEPAEIEAGKELFQQLKDKATSTELVQITPAPEITLEEAEDYPGWNPNSK